MVQWFWWDSSLISTTNWFPSVLWHCWFGHLACKNDLLCVEWDVKPYTLTYSPSLPVFCQHLKTFLFHNYFSWVIAMTVCLPTFLRSHGLWNSFAVLDALSDSDWHEHYSLTLFFAGWWTLIDAGVCSSFGPDAFLLHEQLCQRGISCRNSVCLSICLSVTRMLCDKTKEITHLRNSLSTSLLCTPSNTNFLSKSCPRHWIPCWLLTNTAVTNFWCHKLIAKVIK